MNFEKRGDSRLSILSTVIILIISISLVVGAVSINNSLNQTNSSSLQILNPTSDLNISINVSVGVNQTEENISNQSVINETLLGLNKTIVNESQGNEGINATIGINQTENVNQTIVNESIVIIGEVISGSEIIVNESLINESNTTIKPTLAAVVNGKSIFDDSYTEIYLNRYKNLSDVKFEKIENIIEKPIIMKFGNSKQRLRGFTINNSNYGLHLVGCDLEYRTCNFRINGLLAKDLSPEGINTFDLDTNHQIKINLIEFGYCGGTWFCDYDFRAYDRVEMEVVRK